MLFGNQFLHSANPGYYHELHTVVNKCLKHSSRSSVFTSDLLLDVTHHYSCYTPLAKATRVIQTQGGRRIDSFFSEENASRMREEVNSSHL